MSTLVEIENGCFCWDLDAEPDLGVRAFWDRFLDGMAYRDALGYRLTYWVVRHFIEDAIDPAVVRVGVPTDF